MSVISADERLATYGVPLAERRIQPVWIEIHNATDDMLWMLRSGTDPDCFSPLEVAW